MFAGTPQADQSPETVALIEREQVRLAYGNWRQYVDGVPFALALAVLMCGVPPEAGHASIATAAMWLAAVVVWAASSSLAYRFYCTNEAKRTPDFWRAQLVAIWMAHALVWGSTGWIFWDRTNPVNQEILYATALGIFVSYFFTLTMYFPALLAALATLAVVQWSGSLFYGGTLAHTLMLAGPLFVGVLINYGLKASHKYREALHLRFRNEALAAALMKSNQAKSSFLASMSHELRTPLNAILGYSDLIRQRTFGPIMPGRYAAYVEDIHTSGEHLLKMINDLLDLAKIEAGKREYSFGPIEIATVASAALKLIEPQAQGAHVALMLDVNHRAVIRACERTVKQILINLLSNAVKFSRPGGIAVLFCEILPDGRIAMGVKDTGLGMSPEMQRRAIEPFAQGSDAYTVEGRGTGLGLPIVKNLIEAHQGELKIESALGHGSKIWVEFPPERLIRRAAAA